MADITNKSPRDMGIIEKYIDMGDGTWAKRVASVPVSVAGASKTLISSNSNVGAASTIIVPAGTYASWVTIQNTHASQTLYIGAVAASTSDFKILPGAAITLPFGVANAIYGWGSGAATTFALIGA